MIEEEEITYYLLKRVNLTIEHIEMFQWLFMKTFLMYDNVLSIVEITNKNEKENQKNEIAKLGAYLLELKDIAFGIKERITTDGMEPETIREITLMITEILILIRQNHSKILNPSVGLENIEEDIIFEIEFLKEYLKTLGFTR